MSKVCLILSGAGHLDGSELRESIFTLLALDEKNIPVEIFAPNIDQHHVINHLTGEEMPEKRNVLIEAARVARGKIQDLNELNPENYDALVFPGGFGVAKNLCDFAFKGVDAKVLDKIHNLIKHFHQNKKPICAICIAPALIALTLKRENIEITIGNDEDTINVLEEMGATHIKKPITGFHVDETNKIITTPAYMYGTGKLSNIYSGITQAIAALADMLNHHEEDDA
jgi:enhancing lycopene biosynthesis protein 2